MTPERWQRIRPILDQALELPGEQRAAFLVRACGADAELRADVETLLRAEGGEGPPLEAPVKEYAEALIGEIAKDDSSADEAVGRRVGPYCLMRELGRGGMGAVYLAERADGHFEQRVALKLLLSGPPDPDIERRLHSERQILARLSHPNIARLLDGGVTGDGLPYLAMEYVEGEPLDRYCDSRKLTIRQRLELFMIVTQAIQYAHRNLVVHRDLKPSNILVSEQGEVKLLDFGIAKLLSDEAAVAGITRTGHRWMTPQYAAPEQIRGDPVTTATDVYQLGAVLYHLLAGRPPFEPQGRALHGLEVAVLEREPERPSTVVTRETRGASPQHDPRAVSDARGTEPERLRRMLQGDLDAIVLKALRKEPEARHPSAEAMRDDIQRHLIGRPVQARQGTLAYRARKFVRRNRAVVAAGVLFLALVAAYAATVTVQSGRIRAALDRAELEAETNQQVTDFLLALFEAERPDQARGEEITARELLERGVERAEQLAERPEVQARMLAAMGITYQRLGLYDRARTLLERALALRRDLPGPREVEVAESMNDLGTLLNLSGQYEQAEEMLRTALATRRNVLGPNHEDVAETVAELGAVYLNRDDPEAAERLLREALAMRRRALGDEHELTAESLNDLAIALRERGDAKGAEALFRETLAIYTKALGEDHPYVVTVMGNLANVHWEQGNWAEAESLSRAALAIDRRTLPPNHPDVAWRLNGLASALYRQEKYEEADSLFGEAVRIARQALSDDHPDLAILLMNRARVRMARGRPGEAEPWLREGLAIRFAAYPQGHWVNAVTQSLLGQCLLDLGRYDEAETLLLESHATLEVERGSDDAGTMDAVRHLARLYQAMGDTERAGRYERLLSDTATVQR